MRYIVKNNESQGQFFSETGYKNAFNKMTSFSKK